MFRDDPFQNVTHAVFAISVCTLLSWLTCTTQSRGEMANNDTRGRRVVDSKPVVRAPLDEYGFPHGAGNDRFLTS